MSHALQNELAEDAEQGDRLRVPGACQRRRLQASERQFTSGSHQITIGHATIDGTDGAGCDARGGWYYDKDPMTGAPTKITACPATCTMLQTDLDGKVDVVLGYPTIDVD